MKLGTLYIYIESYTLSSSCVLTTKKWGTLDQCIDKSARLKAKSSFSTLSRCTVLRKSFFQPSCRISLRVFWFCRITVIICRSLSRQEYYINCSIFVHTKQLAAKPHFSAMVISVKMRIGTPPSYSRPSINRFQPLHQEIEICDVFNLPCISAYSIAAISRYKSL